MQLLIEYTADNVAAEKLYCGETEEDIFEQWDRDMDLLGAKEAGITDITYFTPMGEW